MPKMKILFIDDETDFLAITSVKLEGWGYEVIQSPAGQDGVEKLKTSKPDIVLLDYLMRDMDGVDTLKKIREINKDIPVIMFTAYPDMRVVKDTDSLGVSSFVDKLGILLDTDTALKAALKMAEREAKSKKS
jgi:CheY-like chemotaxis protein